MVGALVYPQYTVLSVSFLIRALYWSSYLMYGGSWLMISQYSFFPLRAPVPLSFTLSYLNPCAKSLPFPCVASNPGGRIVSCAPYDNTAINSSVGSLIFHFLSSFSNYNLSNLSMSSILYSSLLLASLHLSITI